MRKPTKQSARQIGKSAAETAKERAFEKPKLTADQQKQIKASRAIDAMVNRADLYTAAVLKETEYSIKRGIASDKHVARTEDARARMLDAVGKLRLIVCPEAAALKS